MRTTFSGISIALNALRAQQVSLDITGHNVANVNNPNYSRQTALHGATRPYPVPMLAHSSSSGQLGTGVEVKQINRMRDSFIDLRLRQQLSNLNYWDALQDGLTQVELFFNEPTENGIHHALDQLWDSLQDLSREPDFTAVREVVLQRAQVLVESISSTRSQLQRLRENVNENIPIKVDEINNLAENLAELNVQIGKVSATGSLPNDLLDTRDAILEELAELVDIEVVQDHANMVGVTIGGANLVHRITAYRLTTAAIPNPNEGYEKSEIRWAVTNDVVNIHSGEIGGLFRFRDEEIQELINDLDQWTDNFAKEFNRIHAQGFDHNGNSPLTSNRFFEYDLPAGWTGNPDQDPVPFAALNLKVNPSIVQDVNLIRAGYLTPTHSGVAEGNGENALRLARLRFTPPQGDSVSLGDSFNAIISKLGVNTQKARKMVDNDQILTTHLENLKDSVSGVSLDEEMANMIRYQHAYGAAARMMTAVDETLDTIIHRLGLVGR